METVRRWLATGPKYRSRNEYDKWRVEYNRKLPEGAPRAVHSNSLRSRWPGGWTKIVTAAEEYRPPGVPHEEQMEGQAGDGEKESEAQAGRWVSGQGEEDRQALAELRRTETALPPI